jgi:hypothetical protein
LAISGSYVSKIYSRSFITKGRANEHGVFPPSPGRLSIGTLTVIVSDSRIKSGQAKREQASQILKLGLIEDEEDGASTENFVMLDMLHNITYVHRPTKLMYKSGSACFTGYKR